jgi:hypothetical protein
LRLWLRTVNEKTKQPRPRHRQTPQRLASAHVGAFIFVGGGVVLVVVVVVVVVCLLFCCLFTVFFIAGGGSLDCASLRRSVWGANRGQRSRGARLCARLVEPAGHGRRLQTRQLVEEAAVGRVSRRDQSAGAASQARGLLPGPVANQTLGKQLQSASTAPNMLHVFSYLFYL